MFELNLIKDKAKARQRRRVIFLSIVSILFLAGLLSIFVGSLFWREIIAVKNSKKEVARVQKSLKDLQAQLDERQPRAQARRNALIQAYQEDVVEREERPYFNPVLDDLAKYHPQTAKFWYNSIVITQPEGREGNNEAEDKIASAKALMGPRALLANGYIEIEQSDVVTESELLQISKQMDGLVKLVGEPKFTLVREKEIIPGGDSEGSRYDPFTMSAAQTVFRSEAP